MTEIVKHDPTGAAPPALPAMQAESVDLEAWAAKLNAASKIGAALASTAFVPAHFQGKPDDAAAAIMRGAELGLTPSQALEMFYVVHGRAGMYARSMAALFMRAGHKLEDVQATDEAVTVRARRNGDKRWQEFTWTIDRAKKAGYTSNKKYQSNPAEMLRAKAWAEAVRAVAPDVLAGLGVYSVEEIELEPELQDLGEKPRQVPTANALPAPDSITEEQWAQLKDAAAGKGISPGDLGNLAAELNGKPLTRWQDIPANIVDDLHTLIDSKETTHG